MIQSLVRQVAERRGISNANQLRVALNISPTLAARLWHGNFTQIGTVTLNRLCQQWKCQPGDLLRYEPRKRKR